ncbi:hypothetical protein PFISCL1PPCAC_25518, partial [Pristionchus fissidentatus]
MASNYLLISPTSIIDIRSPDKSIVLSVSEDYKTVSLRQTLTSDKQCVVRMALRRDKMVISHLATSANIVNGEYKIRIDSLFPLVFQHGETIRCLEAEVFANWECREALSKFSLKLDLHGEIGIDNTQITPVNSKCLKIGSQYLNVSGELLAIHSDFFSTIFYGPYLEKDQQVNTITGVDEEKFVRFLKSIHRKKFVFDSVECTLDALEFSDRFLMRKIDAKVIPYLKEMQIPENLLGYALKAADKVSNKPGL